MGGVVAAVSTSATRFAPSNARERKTPSGTSGCFTRPSTTTKSTSNMAEAASDARVTGETRPTSSTRVIPYTSNIRMTAVTIRFTHSIMRCRTSVAGFDRQ